MSKINITVNIKVNTFYVPKDVYKQMIDMGGDGVVFSDGKLFYKGTAVEISDKDVFDVDFEQSLIETGSNYAPERDIDTVQTGGYTPRGLTAAEAQQIRSMDRFTSIYTGTRPTPPGKE